MKVEEILTNIMKDNNYSKARLGRAVGVVTPEEAEKKPSKATDVINKRMKQKNISVNVLYEMLSAMGYTITIVPKGPNLKKGEYEVTINE